MGNPIFDMMSGSSSAMKTVNQSMQGFGNINEFASMLNNKFGNMQNCLSALSGLMGKRGMNPRQTAIHEIKGKHFSQETIEQFRQFASNNGASEQQINMVLNQLGLN